MDVGQNLAWGRYAAQRLAAGHNADSLTGCGRGASNTFACKTYTVA